MLHGATTAIFAMLSKTLADRHPRSAGARVPAGLGGGGRDSLGVQPRLLPPVAQTLVLLVALPLLVLWIFARSERATREWVGAGLDLDIELLPLVASETLRADAVRPVSAGAARADARTGRRRHVLPAAARARAVGAGEGDAAGARGRLDVPVDDGSRAAASTNAATCSSRSARSGCWR